MTQAPLIAYSSQLSIDHKWAPRVRRGFLLLAISTLLTVGISTLWEVPYWMYITTGTSRGLFFPFHMIIPLLLLSEIIDWIGTVIGIWLVSSRILARTENRSTMMIWSLRIAAIVYQTWRIAWRASVYIFHGPFFGGWHWTILSVAMALTMLVLFYLVTRRVLEFCGLRRMSHELLIMTSAMVLFGILSPLTSWFTSTFFSSAASAPGSRAQWLNILISIISIGFQIWIAIVFLRARIAIGRMASEQAK